MKHIARISVILTLLAVPVTTFAAAPVCSSTICGVGEELIYMINDILVPLLFAVSFIVFLYGVARVYILTPGDASKVGEGSKYVLAGIVGFVIMISMWGLVNVVAESFGLSGDSAPSLPKSY